MKKIQTPEAIKEKLTSNGYKWVSREGQMILVHRLVWEEQFGKIPQGMDIHHKNGNKRDNRIENLQLVTRKEHKRLHKKL